MECALLPAVAPALPLPNAAPLVALATSVWLECAQLEVVAPLALFNLIALAMATALFAQQGLGALPTVEDLAIRTRTAEETSMDADLASTAFVKCHNAERSANQARIIPATLRLAAPSATPPQIPLTPALKVYLATLLAK